MKNKITILIFSFVMLVGCSSQNNKNTIKSFLENTVITSSGDINKMSAYLKISEDALKTNKKLYESIQFNIQFLKNEINSHSDPIEVLTYEEFRKIEEFKAYKVVYEGKDKVYCVVQGKRFITPVLIDKDHKITAFFTGIVKNKDNIVPYILEEQY